MKKKFLKIFSLVFSFVIAFGVVKVEAVSFGSLSPKFNSVELIQNGDIPLIDSAPVLLSSNKAVKSAKQLLIEGLQNAAGEIDLSLAKIPADDLIDLYQDVMNSHPELFYVGFEYGYTCDNSGFISTVSPTYTMVNDEIKKNKDEYSFELQKIVSQINPALSDLEKIVFVHDYLCANFSYDKTESVFDAYTFFVSKTGVCQSYTLAFIAIMNELNINVGYAASDSMNHIWNVVESDGVWYHVDVTWDDTYKQTVCGQVKHSNLLLSDYGIESTGHENWSSNIDYSCSDSTYDTYFWNEMKLPFVWIGDKSFCIVDGVCYSVDLNIGSLKYFGIDTEWMYSGLAIHDENLLVGYKNAVKVYNLSGEFLYDLYASDSSCYIYGLNVNDGFLNFAEAQKYTSELQFNKTKQFINDDMFSIDLSAEIYDGTDIEKEIQSDLVEGEAYNVSYNCNNHTGLAEIEITGIGDFCGRTIYEFYICDDYIFVDDAKDIESYKNSSNEVVHNSLISGSGYENIYGTGSVLLTHFKDSDKLAGAYLFVVNGDTNGDSVCDVLDCALVALVSRGYKTLHGAYKKATDSNLDDEIDEMDYQVIVNIALAY